MQDCNTMVLRCRGGRIALSGRLPCGIGAPLLFAKRALTERGNKLFIGFFLKYVFK